MAEGSTLAERIATIEEAYEYLLAYAAQGRRGTEDEGPDEKLRGFLERAEAALRGLADCASRTADDVAGRQADSYRPFLAILADDANKALAGIAVVQAQRAISSQLVDNLNASIHLRALLTDLFLIDEALKRPDAG